MNRVVTPPCIVCADETDLWLTDDEFASFGAWMLGLHIQQAFPHWDADKREMLMTGIHPECWDQMFEEDEMDLGDEF